MHIYIYTYIFVCVCVCVCVCVSGISVGVFANALRDLGLISGQVISKTHKMVLNPFLLNTQQYKVRMKDKVEQSREKVAPSLTPWCSSYRKGRLRLTLDYDHQLSYPLSIYLSIYLYIYIYIYIYMLHDRFYIYIYIYIYIWEID